MKTLFLSLILSAISMISCGTNTCEETATSDTTSMLRKNIEYLFANGELNYDVVDVAELDTIETGLTVKGNKYIVIRAMIDTYNDDTYYEYQITEGYGVGYVLYHTIMDCPCDYTFEYTHTGINGWLDYVILTPELIKETYLDYGVKAPNHSIFYYDSEEDYENDFPSCRVNTYDDNTIDLLVSIE